MPVDTRQGGVGPIQVKIDPPCKKSWLLVWITSSRQQKKRNVNKLELSCLVSRCDMFLCQDIFCSTNGRTDISVVFYTVNGLHFVYM